MILELVLATTTSLHSQILVGGLLGATPLEVTQRLHLAPSNADTIVAVSQTKKHEPIQVASPDAWASTTAACPKDFVSRVYVTGAPFGGISPRLVFINGRLAHVKALDESYLADADSDAKDVDPGQSIVLDCTQRTHPRVADQIAVGLVFWPYAAGRSVQISNRRAEGRKLFAAFKLSAPAPDLKSLQSEHPGAIKVTDVGDGRRLVRIRFGDNYIGGDPQPPMDAGFDYYAELTGDTVSGLRIGFLLRSRCTLTESAGLTCN